MKNNPILTKLRTLSLADARSHLSKVYIAAAMVYTQKVSSALQLTDKSERQKELRHAERYRRDQYREYSLYMKALHRRLWPPLKKDVSKTSYKGKKRNED